MIYKQIILIISIAVLLAICDSDAQVKYDMIVAADGTGNYTTVQAAFNAVPKNCSTRTVIFIKNGTYKENLTLASDSKNVTIIGQNRDNVKLTYNNYSGKIVNGVTLSTSTSSSTYIKSEGFCAINITFENSSGPVGQAVAIYITGDKSIFYNCRFLGRQDTWYAGRCRQLIRNCYIEGTTDFLFGPSTAWIDSCQIYSYGGTALTAASTEQYVTYGYVFRYCSVTGGSGVSTALGRPWRPYSCVSFLNCSLSSCIKATGWDNWNNPANESTARYSEYKNTGSGADITRRINWAKQLTDAQAEKYTISDVLKMTYKNPPVADNWDPLATLALYTRNSIKTLAPPNIQSESIDFSVQRSSGQTTKLKVTGITGGTPVLFSIHDIEGHLVYQRLINGNNELSFTLTNLRTGIYLARVEKKDFIVCKKISIY